MNRKLDSMSSSLIFFLIVCSVIQLSMDMYTRSPTAYLNLGKVLRLPSPRQLQLYKNYVHQEPGIVHENLHWMLLEAERIKLSQRGRHGFLVFDEVQIQVNAILFSTY